MAHVGRAAGVLPLIGAVAAAAALAGAAVFTVSQAACPNPGHYVQDGVSVHVVGGCFNRAELPRTAVPAEAAGAAGHGTQSRP
ncbi:MAG TPA: hypothetical protein VHF06_05275 [Pseudonocardiaceae bacterium]|jgi:hypothetical protein|nr:hypothetical protein [Pseudonocardiaceae bacterium]